MKSFFLKCLIVLSGIVAVDLAVGTLGEFVIKELNKKKYSGQAALFGYNLQGVNADVVILGSSTASCHYIPSILRDSINAYLRTNYSAFNAGAYYQQSSYPYCVLKGMIERNDTPRIVILDIQPQQLGETINEAALKPMRPYYGTNHNIKEVLNSSESFWNRIFLNSGMFRFNTEILKLVTSFRNPFGADGFDPKEGKMGDFIIIETLRDTNELNTLFVSEFDSTLKMATDNDIEMYVIMSPRLSYVDKNSKSYKKIKEICGKYNVCLFDLSSDADFQKGEYFSDGLHLNPEGAKRLTIKTFELIKKSIRDNNTL